MPFLNSLSLKDFCQTILGLTFQTLVNSSDFESLFFTSSLDLIIILFKVKKSDPSYHVHKSSKCLGDLNLKSKALIRLRENVRKSNYMIWEYGRASMVAQTVKNPPAMQEMPV